MRRIVLVGLALLVSTLGMTLSASARLGIAPMATQDDAVIQVKHGRGIMATSTADAVTITAGIAAAATTSTGITAVIIIMQESSLYSLSSSIAQAMCEWQRCEPVAPSRRDRFSRH